MSLDNLILASHAHYNQLAALRDLEEAVVLAHKASSLCPQRHPLRSFFLNHLAICLSTRYRQLGFLQDLEDAIVACREALSLRPHGHPLRSSSLNNLAADLFTRYNQLRSLRDLDEAVVLAQEALLLCPREHPNRSVSLENLASYLSTRYNQLGALQDLDELIILSREALSLYPQGHPNRSKSLDTLASYLSTRYNMLEALQDLEELIILSREAFSLYQQGHPDRSVSLENLASYLSTRYNRLGVLQDLEEIVILSREVLSLHPQGHPDRAKSLENLAMHLSTRYNKFGAFQDLKDVTILIQEIHPLHPQGHPNHSKSVGNLASYLSTRYKQLGTLQDLEGVLSIMMAEPERVHKVVLFGVTGSGKSSIINLLTGIPVADVSTGMGACTRRAKWYPCTIWDKDFRLWDTMGFNQAEMGDTSPLFPYEQAHALLQNLQGGVDLILLCARKDGINASFRSLYWLLDNFLYRGTVQIALVLTHFDAPDDGWWDRNRHVIAQKCNIPVQFLPHVCITTVPHDPPQLGSPYERSRNVLRALLAKYAILPPPTPLPIDLVPDVVAAAEALNEYCHLSLPAAQKLVETFRSPKRPFHVILFGESGAGKSSVVNLLVGDSWAPVSSGINSSTLDYRNYKINTGLHEFLVWDIVGFDGIHIDHSVCGKAIENAVHLIRDLHQRGGVDLLVFCKRDGRFSLSEKNNFRLFHEFLCEGQIPVAFIITHLEHRDSMEEWWADNGVNLLKACNLKTAAGHACITSIGNNQIFHEKRSRSRQLVHAMLEDAISYGPAFTKNEEIWVMTFLRKLVGLIRVGNPPTRRRDRITIKNLMDRCGLTKEQAEELIKMLYMMR